MTRHPTPLRPDARPSLKVLAGVLLAAAAIGACNRQGATPAASSAAPLALPLTVGAQTPIAPAPAAEALPSAPRPKVVRVADPNQAYAYLDQAYAMSDALSDAPPDYGFDYGGVRPWVWRGADRSYRVAEPVEGGYRYYYYRTGSDYPYLVQDPDYAYAYDGDQLAVVYDRDGRPLPPPDIDRRADDAGRYLARAHALYQAQLNSQRHAVIAANWAARRAQIQAQRAEWAAQQARDEQWRAYHDQHEAEEEAYWRREREERQAAQSRFDAWREARFEGPPPPPAWRGEGDRGDRGPDDRRHDDRGPGALAAGPQGPAPTAGAPFPGPFGRDQRAAPPPSAAPPGPGPAQQAAPALAVQQALAARQAAQRDQA
ncbi:MAG: hypothetical protein JSR86_08360, partial [Proteobacteria bacterium]|nr:hypothetical protein [Pseudomonadota bacterium]